MERHSHKHVLQPYSWSMHLMMAFAVVAIILTLLVAVQVQDVTATAEDPDETAVVSLSDLPPLDPAQQVESCSPGVRIGAFADQGLLDQYCQDLAEVIEAASPPVEE